MGDSNERISAATRSTITIPPPRPPSEALSAAPGTSPMTIVANLFANNFPDVGADFPGSFSQLLAGDMDSPSAAPPMSFLGDGSSSSDGKNGSESGPGFKQNRPANLTVPVQAAVSPLFPISPGFSPSAFFNSPAAGFLSPALAALSHSVYQSSSSSSAPMGQLATNHQPFTFNTPAEDHKTSLFISEPNKQRTSELPQSSHVDGRVNDPLPAPVDKPADDGYNWRKYGQKQVKCSEYPRSYYRCTYSNCPVKKKVERSKDGHIIEIIYKGQHNHDPPQPGRRIKDNSNSDDGSQWSNGALPGQPAVGLDEDSAQATSIQLHGPSDSEESGDGYQEIEGNDDDEEPNAKRRNTGAGASEAGMSRKTVTEPKIILQTRSQVDLLDDGYRWRKYGQKVVKGNPNPRSYYKCTTTGCGVRKHVERSSTDPEAVITTYEGKHNHDVPLGRNNASNTAQQMTLHNSRAGKHASGDDMDSGNKGQRPIAFLRLKEEQVLV